MSLAFGRCGRVDGQAIARFDGKEKRRPVSVRRRMVTALPGFAYGFGPITPGRPMPSPDPAVFRDDAIAPETRAHHEDVARRMKGADIWAVPAEEIREQRRQGKGAFPMAPKSPRAVTETISGPHGPIELRFLAPERPRGVYLHIHGGGWMLGQADFQDPALERLGERLGLAAVSVEYHLAPEHPFPAAPDDCEAAAQWLVEEAPRRFGTDRLFIGGESAGANLSVLTLIRLRDRLGRMPFAGANLTAGCYDLGLTPSARRWGQRGLILDTRDVQSFAKTYLGDGRDPRDPAISPLYADLAGLPPALFSVGTYDALLDDSLFMAARWEAAGGHAELAVWPGGVHVFQSFDFPLAREAFEREVAFLGRLFGQTRAV
jgi:acetyl esterase/lipase